MQPPDSAELCNLAVRAALRSGEVLARGFGTAFEIDSKDGKHDLVTEYDKRVEKLIIEMISKLYPDHGFLAEESGTSGDTDGQVLWIVDPLDGTVNFARGVPMFSVSIAAAVEGVVVCGVVYNPMVGELFVAEKGKGASLNGAPIKVTTCKGLRQGVVATGLPYNVAENPHHCIDQLAHIAHLGIPIRRIGSAALDLAYVASGKFDGFWEVILRPWDFAAGKILVEEAGGKVTSLNGSPVCETRAGPIVATNGILHAETLDHLSRYDYNTDS